MGTFGILPVVKPTGRTSHDVVDEIRRLFGEKRVGHGGTLDPSATGVLIVGVGKATRILRYFHLLDKTYDAVVAFGAATSTLDAEGEVVETSPADFTRKDLERALAGFIGEIHQVPPMVSAVKRGGEALYKKARRGESVEREARRQYIYDIRLTSPPVTSSDGLMRVAITVRCDSGTYIRSLAAEIAEALGTVGHLACLDRTAVGPFGVEDSITLEHLASMSSEGRRSALIWGPEAIPHLPVVTLQGRAATDAAHGRSIRLGPDAEAQIRESLEARLAAIPHLEESLVHEGLLEERRYRGPVALVAENESLIAMARPEGDILTFDCVLV